MSSFIESNLKNRWKRVVFDPAVWAESGHTVKVEVTVKQHLRGPFITSQQADLSWRRRSSYSGEVSCPLNVNVHPSIGGHPQPDWHNLWPRSASVCVGVRVCGGVAVGGAEGPFIQAGRWWAVVISMLLLSLTIRHILLLNICYGNNQHVKNYTASTERVCDGQWCVGGSKVPPLRFTWHVSSTSTLTSTKKSQYIIAEWRKYTLDSVEAVFPLFSKNHADIVQLYSTSGPHRGSGPAKKLDYCYYYNYNIIYNLI